MEEGNGNGQPKRRMSFVQSGNSMTQFHGSQMDLGNESKMKSAQMHQSISKRVQMLSQQGDIARAPVNTHNNSGNSPGAAAGGALGGFSAASMLNSERMNKSQRNNIKQFSNKLDPEPKSLKNIELLNNMSSQPNNQFIQTSSLNNIQSSQQQIPQQTQQNNQIDPSQPAKKGIFEEYQSRWSKNNKKIFRFLITWKVGDGGKIEDQLKLMITYLSIIFVVILFICGFATTFYFHMTNKVNIQNAIEEQASTILSNGLIQYKNSTEYVFKGYEFVLNYLSELVLSKLEISYKIYNFSDIAQFPYKGPNRMRRKDQDNAKCVNYTGNVVFESHAVSLKCIDWYEFDTSVVPLVNDAVYQVPIDTATLNGAIDILNYVLESQIFDVFVTKIFKIYFGFEYRTAMYGYPGWMMSNVPETFPMHDRPWYNHTRLFHINQKDESVFRVISTPYYDTGTNTRVVTISRAILAPSASDVDKRYLVGKGRFMGVASVDIKLKEFQELFEDITFYSTGYLAIVNTSGKLLNEPSEFITQAEITGTYEDLDINELLEEEDWQVILNSKEDQLLSQVTSIHGLKLVVASTINSANFYSGEALVILLIIPYSEVYGEITTQNNNNLKNILISSMVSLAVFIVSTIICMVYVKKKIVHMVSAITELNKCALSLTSSNANQQEGVPENGTGAAPNAASSIPGKNPTTSVPAVNNGNNNNTNDQQVESSHSKKQVMERLNAIQQNSESETIKELVKGFENQLKGISKLGKGGQNILKNGKSTLKYEQAEYGGTQLPNYIEPLLGYLNAKKEKMDSEPSFQLSQYSAVSQLQIKTLTNQFKKPPNTLSSQMNIVTPRNLSVDNNNNNNNNLQNQMFFNGLNSNMNTSDRDKEQPSHRQKQEAPEINQNISGNNNNNNNNNNSNGNNDQLVDLAQFDNDTIDIDMISMKENSHHP